MNREPKSLAPQEKITVPLWSFPLWVTSTGVWVCPYKIISASPTYLDAVLLPLFLVETVPLFFIISEEITLCLVVDLLCPWEELSSESSSFIFLNLRLYPYS